MLRIHLITLFFAQLKLTPLISVRYSNIIFISPKRTESIAFGGEPPFDIFFFRIFFFVTLYHLLLQRNPSQGRM